MSDERRIHVRYPMGRGSARIEGIQPESPIPRGRARVVDWSRGGALIELKVPLRRAPSWRASAYEGHWLALTVKLPPRSATVEVHARVSHAHHDPRHPDVVMLGLTFDAATLDAAPVAELDQILEARLPRELRRSRRPVLPEQPAAESLARESDRMAKSSRRLLEKSRKLAQAARRLAREGDPGESKILACESRQLEERGRELERQSRLCAARYQQRADAERMRLSRRA